MVSRYSPLLVGFGHWEIGAQAVGRYLKQLTVRIGRAQIGQYIEVPAPPQIANALPSPIPTPWATLIHVYSLPAWAELSFPERRIEFQENSGPGTSPDPKPGVLVIGVRKGEPARDTGNP